MLSYSRTVLVWCAVQGAAEHDRLASNTYRRLNLGLAAWAAANLTLLAKGAASQVVTWCTGYISIKPLAPSSCHNGDVSHSYCRARFFRYVFEVFSAPKEALLSR